MLKLKDVIGVLCTITELGLYPVNGKSDHNRIEMVLNADCIAAREQRPLLSNTKIYVKMSCEASEPIKIAVFWTLTERECWYDDSSYLQYGIQTQENNISLENVLMSPRIIEDCARHSTAMLESNFTTKNGQTACGAIEQQKYRKQKTMNTLSAPALALSLPTLPVVTLTKDGIYDLVITVDAVNKNVDFSAVVYIDIIGPHGYISATDWQLLPFFGIMCIVYVILGTLWLVVSFMQWRDLLRIQFWIGGVILLGMLEKAFFYAQYHSLSTTGVSVHGVELTAEFVSCAKRTLARMLVIIMSLGFGIVKPRLGPMLHRVVGVGMLYLVLACVESYLRVMQTKTDERNELLVASIPLAVLDTGICWWIFMSLVHTTRTLRLRRNIVKLSLYKHFTNTLILAVFASVVFMLYVMHLQKLENCTPGWHNIWIDTAFWHVLFSILLLVVMVLWRPTNNNQRYAFTPLLDNPEDEDDEEEDQFIVDAYGVKMRGIHLNNPKIPPPLQKATTAEEDDLRWVEENIPSSMLDSALPVLDSDEEIINTKFEVSKMQ